MNVIKVQTLLLLGNKKKRWFKESQWKVCQNGYWFVLHLIASSVVKMMSMALNVSSSLVDGYFFSDFVVFSLGVEEHIEYYDKKQQ